jgi:hypothetical protein
MNFTKKCLRTLVYVIPVHCYLVFTIKLTEIFIIMEKARANGEEGRQNFFRQCPQTSNDGRGQGEKKNCFGGTWHLKREYAQDGSKEYLDDASFFFHLIYVLEPAPQSTPVLHETYTQGRYVTDSMARRGMGRREITPTDFKTVEPKHWRRNHGAGLGARGLMHRG